MSDIANIPVLVPPLDEQQQIVCYLDSGAAKIDALIAKAQQAIALMREHRTSLIAAAVTGKIDVRGVVAGAASEAEAGRLAGVAR
jgi:type I restriction enzyme S subunit